MHKSKKRRSVLMVVENHAESSAKILLSRDSLIHKPLSIETIEVVIRKSDLNNTKRTNKNKIDKLTEIFGK